jgi:hypothetical protein
MVLDVIVFHDGDCVLLGVGAYRHCVDYLYRRDRKKMNINGSDSNGGKGECVRFKEYGRGK